MDKERAMNQMTTQTQPVNAAGTGVNRGMWQTFIHNIKR